MSNLISLENEIRQVFKKAFPFESTCDNFDIQGKFDKHARLFKKIERAIVTNKRLDTVSLTTCRYSIEMHTNWSLIKTKELDKEAWFIPVTVYDSIKRPNQFIRYRVSNNKTNKELMYSNVTEMNEFDIYKFNAEEPYGYINNSEDHVEFIILWFKKGKQ